MCQEEGFKVFLDNKNSRALPSNLACLECLNVQSPVDLPSEEVSLLVQHSLVTINCTLTIGIAGLEFRYCKVRVAGYIRNDSHFINLDSVCIHTYLDSISIKTSSVPFKYSFQVWKKPWQTPLIKAPSKGENKEQRKRREEDQNLTESKEWSPKCVTSYLIVTHSSTFVHVFIFISHYEESRPMSHMILA